MGNILPFMQTHPLLAVLLGGVGLLALVGLWYVVAHHLQAIVITLVCALGAACGAVVLWRGVGHDLLDLIAIGCFLLVLFPVLLYQAIRRKKHELSISVTQIPGVISRKAA